MKFTKTLLTTAILGFSLASFHSSAWADMSKKQLKQAITAIENGDNRVAFKIFLEHANKGDVAAQLGMLLMYDLSKNRYDYGYDYTWEDAKNWCWKAYEGNLLEGIRRWWEVDDSAVSVVSRHMLGLIHEFGNRKDENDCGYRSPLILSESEAKEQYSWAAEEGYAPAQLHLSEMLEDYDERVKWLKKSAEQGYANAQYELGYLYGGEFSWGEKNELEAAKWYKKAAEQGQSGAQNALANMYWEGNGVEQNYSEAVKWYKKFIERADDGRPYFYRIGEAKLRVGKAYYEGLGGPQNKQLAKEWFKQSCEFQTYDGCEWYEKLDQTKNKD